MRKIQQARVAAKILTEQNKKRRGTVSRFDMNLLGALEALLDERNVTRAAARCGVTQPTMSGMLQRLRYQLDDELLVRNGRNMELTHYGKHLIVPVRQALQSVECLLQSEPKFDPAISERTFKVMASDYCTLVFMPRLVAHLAKVAPGLHLVIEPMNSPLERLISAEIDFCISADGGVPFTTDEQIEIHSSHLFSDEFVCIVGEDHPLDAGATMEEFLAFPHIGVQMPGVSTTIEIAAIRQHDPAYEPSYLVADFSFVASMVAGTNLVGLVQRRLAERAAGSMPVRYFAPPFAVTNIDEELRWHPRYLDDQGHKWLRKTVLDVSKDFTSDRLDDFGGQCDKNIHARPVAERPGFVDVHSMQMEQASLVQDDASVTIISKAARMQPPPARNKVSATPDRRAGVRY